MIYEHPGWLATQASTQNSIAQSSLLGLHLYLYLYLFTLKYRKKNTGTRSFQDCVIKESIRCESISADLDAMSESAIL